MDSAEKWSEIDQEGGGTADDEMGGVNGKKDVHYFFLPN